MEAAHQSFFHDAMCDETNQSPVDVSVELPESRDELASSNDTPEPSNAIVEQTEMLGCNDPPRALVIFVLGEHRFSDSCELGVINEHPDALQAITSNQCLSTSAFLKPVLHTAMAELRPSMMMQVAVRLTAITMRLAAKILQTQDTTTRDLDVYETEHHRLSKTIYGELERAVPYYRWQGPRNYYGRVQYLMALLQEAIRVLAVPTSSLAEALKEDAQGDQATKQLARSVFDLGDSLSDVCGTWAAENVLSWWEKQSGLKTPLDQRADIDHEILDDGTKPGKPPSCMTPNSDSEQLPSPSTFVRKRPVRRTSPNSTAAETSLEEALNDGAAKQGSREDDPMCISDSEVEDIKCPSPKLSGSKSDLKAVRYSCRGEAQKDVDYSTKHHPQDPDIPGFGKRRMTKSEGETAAARMSSAKRRKMFENAPSS